MTAIIFHRLASGLIYFKPCFFSVHILLRLCMKDAFIKQYDPWLVSLCEAQASQQVGLFLEVNATWL